MAEVEEAETIVEAREELMVSVHGEENPQLRLAYFLNPCIEQHAVELDIPPPPKSAKPNCFKMENLLNSVEFRSRLRGRKWNEWVNQLLPRYKTTWVKSGILDAIMGSTYNEKSIRRGKELVLQVAENWCSETNTFIFPWGEATITLEDMMVLGGFSVLGESVSSFRLTPEMKKVEEKLVNANRELMRVRNCSPQTSTWMNHFMGTGHELEHEAFLTMWLARFVFPRHGNDRIVKWYFHIAVGLARGTLIALAPAVLVNIYRDMSLLRGRIAELNEGLDVAGVTRLRLTAPLELVKLWIWERFPKLRPRPNTIKDGEPRPVMWHSSERLEAVNVRLAIDTSGECFQWLPYGETTCISSFCRFYRDKEQHLPDCEDCIREMEVFARCVRISELVGIDNCIQKYLPHRVAMQFGFDLDIPANVIRCIDSPEMAWNYYNRPYKCADLQIPPINRSCCTSFRYIHWWRKTHIVPKDVTKGILKRKRCSPRVPSTAKRLQALESFFSTLEFDRRGQINDTTSCMSSVWISAHSTAAKLGKSEASATDGTVEISVGEGASIAAPVSCSLLGTSDTKLSKEAVHGNTEEETEATNMEPLGILERNRGSCGEGQARSIAMELEAKIENIERMLIQVKSTFAAKLKKCGMGVHYSSK